MRKTDEKIRSDIQRALSKLTDAEKVDSVELFEVWDAPRDYETGKYIQHNGLLYKVRQAHTSERGHEPSIYTAALYEEISLEDGTLEHPIHYNNNMALEKDKYYLHKDIEYICTRSTGVPVYNDLYDLVGIYVAIVND